MSKNLSFPRGYGFQDFLCHIFSGVRLLESFISPFFFVCRANCARVTPSHITNGLATSTEE